MYINTKNIFNESVKFTLKNLSDLFNGSNASLKDIEKKMEQVRDEFYSRYKLYELDKRKIEKAILEYNAKSKLYEIIDFKKCDSFHHLHMFLKMDDADFAKMDVVRMYSVYHKILGGPALSGYYTKYIYTVPIADKYIVFIAFDENKVHSVEAIASENMFDISANMAIVKLKINTKIFDKENM